MHSMKIQNIDKLAQTAARQAALMIAEAGLRAIDTPNVIRSQVRLTGGYIFIGREKYELRRVGDIIFIGVGKCALEAGRTIEEILGARLTAGVAVDVKPGNLSRIRSYAGTHPLPSAENIQAAADIVRLLQGRKAADLIIFAISGGGSTLLCLPEDLGCEEEKAVFQTLTQAGAAIQEINTVRKHLSLARGGYLAKYAYPAQVVSLIFSDVPGDNIQFVASGPTVKDATTIQDAEAILQKYDVLKKCGLAKCGLVETPKDDKYFARGRVILAASGGTALRAMAAKAAELGYAVEIRQDQLTGEARAAAQKVANDLRQAPPRRAILWSGETTVELKGRGRGGRNTELALAALPLLQADELVLALASDGRDNGEAAGALADLRTAAKSADLRLDAHKYLEDNNGYPFFEQARDQILTGHTGSNVADLLIALKS